MTRKLVFWLVFALASLGCVVFAYSYFSQAFPIVSLDIAMDREGALRSARDLAEERELGPSGFKQAASFGVDQRVQTFVELEGGGVDAFGRMLSEGLFAAYTWRVRHFREGEVTETRLRFRPDGSPYGFAQKIDENAPGERLSSEQARGIAETVAARDWDTALEIYDLVETSQEVRPGERVDHTFVYERPDEQLGEGRYRLRLVVSGDELTEVTYFVKIPEAFERRYEEMRAANMAIGAVSTVGMLLYVVGVAVGLSSIPGFAAISAALMLLMSAADRFTRGWSCKVGLASSILIAAGMVVSGLALELSLAAWIASGLATGLVVLAAARTVARLDISTVPLMVGTMMVLVRVREGLYRAYPGALVGSILGAVLVALIAWLWSEALRRDPLRTGSSIQAG